jgi:hypothetical protein
MVIYPLAVIADVATDVCSSRARLRFAPAGDDDRCAGRLYHRGADRAEQHPGKFTVAAGADHDQLRGFGLLDEVVRGPVEYDHTAHTNIGVTFLPACKALGKGFMRFRLYDAPFQLVNAEGIAVA